MQDHGVIESVRSSFGAKLAVALLAVVALVVGFGFVVHAETSATLQEDVSQELQTAAATRAAELDTWISGIRRQTRLHSSRSVLQSGDERAISAHLSEVVKSDAVPKGVVAVHYYDRGSKTIVASSAAKMEGVRPAAQGAPFATDPPTFSGPDDTYVTAPFTVPIVDFPVISVISPIAGTEDKALVYMINLEAHTEAFANAAGGGSTVVLDGQGRIIAHPNTERLLDQYGGDVSALADGGFQRRGETLVAGAGMETLDWTVLVRTPRAQAYALGSQVISSILGLILLALVSLAFVGVVVGSNTIVSLRHLARRADAMAGGDLDVDLSTTRTDEFGTLYRSFDEMRGELRTQIRSMEEKNESLEATAAAYGDVMDDVADGDLTRRLDPDTDHEAMADIAVSFNAMLDAVEETLTEVKAFSEHVVAAADRVDAGADEVTEASEQVTEATTEISDGTERQTEALHDVSSEVDSLSSSAEEIAATVDEVAESSERAAAVGEEGQARAERAIDEMDAVERATIETAEEVSALAEELDAVSEVVEVISDIAEETNLLAVNASIEAARTGEEGNGFAVVADEIQNLAEETADSAAEIEDSIEQIQARADETTEAMEETRERIESGVGTVEEVVDALENIAAAADETDESIQEIRDATAQQASSATAVVDRVDDVAAIGDQTAEKAADAAAAAEQQTSTMTNVSEAAEQLTAQARELRVALEDFTVDEGGSAGVGSDRERTDSDLEGIDAPVDGEFADARDQSALRADGATDAVPRRNDERGPGGD
ncbi:MAG: methyl-accepting chemotaxis protein [Haloquadratum sp.]